VTASCRRRSRPGDEQGFSLVEGLVVLLIMGVLLILALPGFLGARGTASDVEARAAIRTAHITLEGFYSDRQTYAFDAAALRRAEPANGEALNLRVRGDASTYRISVDSRGKDGGGTFTQELRADGRVVRTCENHGRGLCKASADAAGNWW
jgi:prepilin-type N-terminal cleavage/methylation domain-containing protein